MTDNLDHYEMGLAAAKINELHLGCLLRLVSSRSQSPA